MRSNLLWITLLLTFLNVTSANAQLQSVQKQQQLPEQRAARPQKKQQPPQEQEAVRPQKLQSFQKQQEEAARQQQEAAARQQQIQRQAQEASRQQQIQRQAQEVSRQQQIQRQAQEVSRQQQIQRQTQEVARQQQLQRQTQEASRQQQNVNIQGVRSTAQRPWRCIKCGRVEPYESSTGDNIWTSTQRGELCPADAQALIDSQQPGSRPGESPQQNVQNLNEAVLKLQQQIRTGSQDQNARPRSTASGSAATATTSGHGSGAQSAGERLLRETELRALRDSVKASLDTEGKAELLAQLDKLIEGNAKAASNETQEHESLGQEEVSPPRHEAVVARDYDVRYNEKLKKERAQLLKLIGTPGVMKSTKLIANQRLEFNAELTATLNKKQAVLKTLGFITVTGENRARYVEQLKRLTEEADGLKKTLDTQWPLPDDTRVHVPVPDY